MEYLLPLEEGYFYHVFNRGNNGCKLFYEQKNYIYFLEKLQFYFSDYLNFYAYCLLPNHFHLMIQVKDFKFVPKEKQLLKSGTKYLANPEEIISEQFRRFFLSYSKSIKVQENRTGSLFEKNFKRIKIDSPDYFTTVINYIHRNPFTHNLTADYKNYKYSSFQSFISDKPTNICRKEVLDWFGGKEEFIRYHDGNPVNKSLESIL